MVAFLWHCEEKIDQIYRETLVAISLNAGLESHNTWDAIIYLLLSKNMEFVHLLINFFSNLDWPVTLIVFCKFFLNFDFPLPLISLNKTLQH